MRDVGLRFCVVYLLHKMAMRAGGIMSGNGNGAASNGKGNNYKVPTGRAEWIKRKGRGGADGRYICQMHFARKGMITRRWHVAREDFGGAG